MASAPVPDRGTAVPGSGSSSRRNLSGTPDGAGGIAYGASLDGTRATPGWGRDRGEVERTRRLIRRLERAAAVASPSRRR